MKILNSSFLLFFSKDKINHMATITHLYCLSVDLVGECACVWYLSSPTILRLVFDI